MKRREFLKTVGTFGAVASIPQSSNPQKIDIHNHYYPESYFQMIRDLAGDDYAFDTDTTGTTIIKFRGARFFGILRYALRYEQQAGV